MGVNMKKRRDLDMEWDLPAISNISASVRFAVSPLHSLALMPKRDVKNDSGRKLISLEKLWGTEWRNNLHYCKNGKHHDRS